MREQERLAYRDPVRLRNVGRCPSCGARCSLPCMVCNHPRRRNDELVAELRDRERADTIRRIKAMG